MKKPVITLLHIGYWLVYLLLLLLVLLCIQLGSNISKHPLFSNWRFNAFLFTLTVIPALIGFYSSYCIVFKKYLAKKKITHFFISLITFSVAGTIAGAVCLSVLQHSQIGTGIFTEGLASAAPAFIIMFIITFLNSITGLVMKGFITWYADIKIKEDLTEKNHATELALVRSQLDPHFLFNTINNIDVLIEKDPTTASTYLNKLSHIMRFMLYETKTQVVSLQKELEYIEKYIELQKIRSSNKEYINYKTDISNNNLNIPPMLFIPFIENAIKYAPNKKEDAVITILFEQKGNSINFYCENMVNHNKLLIENHGGLGLELIQKRLQLLYPGQHELTIQNTGDLYKVHLIIYCT